MLSLAGSDPGSRPWRFKDTNKGRQHGDTNSCQSPENAHEALQINAIGVAVVGIIKYTKCSKELNPA
jgi:hypothetical protein